VILKFKATMSGARYERKGDRGFGRDGVLPQGDNHSSFFFSNFPHGYGEMDMAKLFQKWARVKEVFISRRLNKWGRRFGFVKLLDVKNEARLERELDQIYIGNRKLHVNIPRFRRYQFEPRKVEHKTQRTQRLDSQKEARARLPLDVGSKGEQSSKGIWVERNRNRTFADVVKGPSQKLWKGPSVKTQYHTPQWMSRSFVGKLGEGMDFEKLEEELVKGGMATVRARWLGDNLVMLTPREGEAMEDLLKMNRGWFDSLFSSISPWASNCGASHRSVWVRCYALPLPAWNRDCFSKVIGELSRAATVEAIDEATLNWEVLEYARLRVRVPTAGSVRMARRMQINVQMCNILIEEEPHGCSGQGYNENLSWDISSDSVSSSETYVEESALSVRSGEEKVWFKRDVVRRPEGENEGGEEVEEGVKSLPRSTFPFLGSALKSNDSSGKGRGNITKGVSLENDPVKSLYHVYEDACPNNSILSEAAKVVIDVECVSNQNLAPKEVGRGCISEARSHECEPNVLTQKERSSAGPSRLSKGEVFGPRGTGSNVVVRRDNELSEGSKGRTRHNKVVSPVNRSDGTQTLGSGLLPKQLMHKGQPSRLTGQVGSVDDECVGVMSPLSVGVEEAMEKSRSNSPPRRRKKKGIAELSDSCPFPRRSLRLSAKQSKAVSLVHDGASLSSISISDRDIRTCNLRLREPDNTDEPVSLWAVGKQAGILCRGEEEEVVLEYGRMEVRDSEVLLCFKEGDKNVSL